MNRKRYTAMVLSGALGVGMLLAGCAAGQEQAQEDTGSGITAEEALEQATGTTRTVDTSKDDKTETVYAKADAEGNVEDVTVETVLKNTGTDTIADQSSLSDIKNTNGDEEYEEREGGAIIWQNHGEDISYKGSSTEALPVSVQISYELDGKPIMPEELVGQSGKVCIRLDYENKSMTTVTVDGEEISVPVPFAVLSTMVLPEDTFYNIKVKNGKAVSMDDQNIVIGYACPGLKDSLRLAEFEPTEDITIPDYVEITADVEDFELAFTATVVSNGMFSDMDLSDLDDVEDMIDDMSELNDASGQLVDGAAELFDGVQTMHSYMGEYLKGVAALNTGAQTFSDALEKMNTQKSNLLDGAEALKDGLTEMNDALNGASMPELDSDAAAAVRTAAAALADDTASLSKQLSALEDTLEKAQDIADEAEEYQKEVKQAAEDAKSELKKVSLEEAEKTAKQQARAATREALADTELTEEEKEAAASRVADSIDLSDVTAAVEQHLAAAESRLNDLPELDVQSISVDTDAISETVADMKKQLGVLEEYTKTLSGMMKGLSGMEDSLSTLRAGVKQLKTGSEQLAAGIGVYNQGIEQLYQGAISLRTGTAQLAEAGSQLDSGFGALSDGTGALATGLKTFDEEAIDGLTDLAGDDLKTVMTRLRAVKRADSSYNNFSGIRDDQTGSVKFIIETEGIEKD
ncbi:MAG: hypothetical protein Q4P20_01155 [Eubacteriales bacterium]|nr:hypothetical protein [Eubacteriales bacterium]